MSYPLPSHIQAMLKELRTKNSGLYLDEEKVSDEFGYYYLDLIRMICRDYEDITSDNLGSFIYYSIMEWENGKLCQRI